MVGTAAITSNASAIGACCISTSRGACPNYLALTYILSSRDTTLCQLSQALQTLDEVARIKQSDAILCDAWNLRISDRLFARWGWEPHKPQAWHRNFIKRFYGVYPKRQEVEPEELLAVR